jgi:deoxyribodipyrimidine photo-lyase
MNVFWFRRDLRLDDNAGLYHALKDGRPVLPVFIFDTNILDDLEQKDDARVMFIHDRLVEMDGELHKLGSALHVYHGTPEKVFRDITTEFAIEKVFTNRDYELYALERDSRMIELLAKKAITFHDFKDQVIFDRSEIMKDDGTPYAVFTPYSRKWRSELTPFHFDAYPTKKFFRNFYQCPPKKVPSLGSIGFRKSKTEIPSREVPDSLFKNYQKERDFPADDGTSRLGIHLRFGTISIRRLAAHVKRLSDVYLSELIWREFYQMVLFHFPHVGRGEAFKREYDRDRVEV